MKFDKPMLSRIKLAARLGAALDEREDRSYYGPMMASLYIKAVQTYREGGGRFDFKAKLTNEEKKFLGEVGSWAAG